MYQKRSHQTHINFKLNTALEDASLLLFLFFVRKKLLFVVTAHYIQFIQPILEVFLFLSAASYDCISVIPCKAYSQSVVILDRHKYPPFYYIERSKSKMSTKLKEQQIMEYKEAFTLFDKQGTGEISTAGKISNIIVKKYE